ncbi:MAG: helix-turn-helix domain-containing protein [Candidatus Bathyarchaeia archaeon]
MISIFELGYRYVIPSIKRRLTEKLIEVGLTQREAARKLGLSISTVSRYLSMERGVFIDLASYSDVDKTVNDLALAVKDDSIDFYDIQIWIHRIAFYMLSRKYICKIHAKIDLGIDPDRCSICPKLIASHIDISKVIR